MSRDLPPVLAAGERLVTVDAIRVAGMARTDSGWRVSLVVPADQTPEAQP